MVEQGDLFFPGLGDVAAISPIVEDGVPCECARQRLTNLRAVDPEEAETLALILRRCLPPGANADRAADALMARFGCLARIFGAPEADLARVVGAAAAGEVALLHRLLLRVLEHPLRRRTVLSSHAAVTAYLRVRLAALPREVFHVLFLGARNQLIADERLGVGTVNHAPVYPREVVRRALELSAGRILLAHNHPSGDPTPSRADIEMTRHIVDAAKILQIAVHDHLIVAGDEVASLRVLGLM